LLQEGGANIEDRDGNEDTALLRGAQSGQLETVMWLLLEGGADIGEGDEHQNSALLLASENGMLATVKWLLRKGGADIWEVDDGGDSALMCAAYYEELDTVQWLLKEGGSSIREANNIGWTALISAAVSCKLATVQYLLEYGGADIGDTDNHGKPIWELLAEYLAEAGRDSNYNEDDDEPYVSDATAVTSFPQTMVLRGTTPAELTTRLSPEHAQVVRDGARLKARLPAYLARRWALLDVNCLLIPPLRALVHGYEEPTTDDLWATGLGTVTLPYWHPPRQRGPRARRRR
jgi:hypothetical protein